MASRHDAALDGFDASANTPNPQSITFFMRLRRRGAGGSTGELALAGYTSGWALAAYLEYVSGSLYARNGGGGSVTLGTMTDDVWYDVALVNSGNSAGNLIGYYGQTGGAWSSGSSTGTSETNITYLYLAYHNSSYWFNCEIDDVRIWSSALSADELAIERAKRRPSRTTDLNRWLPMLYASATDNAKDRSGNGYNLTVQGTPTIVDGAPVGWGGSIVAPQYVATETAPVLSLPGVQSITATTAVPKVTLTFS